mmetsp:Transcript_59552/g.139376  ORF Transcript_59552/g.139376 Transcript_59552/m.139376 type:complete len:92 (+) Transcript_59552:567-842(+)
MCGAYFLLTYWAFSPVYLLWCSAVFYSLALFAALVVCAGRASSRPRVETKSVKQETFCLPMDMTSDLCSDILFQDWFHAGSHGSSRHALCS